MYGTAHNCNRVSLACRDPILMRKFLQLLYEPTGIIFQINMKYYIGKKHFSLSFFFFSFWLGFVNGLIVIILPSKFVWNIESAFNQLFSELPFSSPWNEPNNASENEGEIYLS